MAQRFKDNWFAVLVFLGFSVFIGFKLYQEQPSTPPPPEPSLRIFRKTWGVTEYDKHRWVTYGDAFAHHPDCPCLRKTK
jgi:hypothetical protein